MPSYTLNTSAENWIRIKDAVIASVAREEDETDVQLYVRWLRGRHIELVFRHERRLAEGAVGADPDIVDVT